MYRLAHAVEGWRRTSGSFLRPWLRALGELEVVSSLAGHRHEHPRDVFPELTTNSPLLDGEALARPLLGVERVVSNDVRLAADLQVLVVSGSNMSAKSTLLRTVGVNAVLAQASATVRTRRLRLSPISIGTSIRIVDSL